MFYLKFCFAHLKVNNPELALTIYKKLLEINSLNSQWWTGIGMTYQALKKYDLAEDAFNKVIKYTKENPKLLALAHQKVGALKELREQAKSDTQQPS